MKFYRIVTVWPDGREEERLSRETLTGLRMRARRDEAQGAHVRIWEVGAAISGPSEWGWPRFMTDYTNGILRIDWAAVVDDLAHQAPMCWRVGFIHYYREHPIRPRRPLTRAQREAREVLVVF